MDPTRTDWILEGISTEAQAAAANAAQAEGISLEEWVARLIREESSPSGNEPDFSLTDEKLTSIERAMLRARSKE